MEKEKPLKLLNVYEHLVLSHNLKMADHLRKAAKLKSDWIEKAKRKE